MDDKKIDIQNLTDKDKESIGQHYNKEFAGFLNMLQFSLAQTVIKKDPLAFVFLCDCIIALIKTTAKHLDLDDTDKQKIDNSFTWTTPTVGKC